MGKTIGVEHKGGNEKVSWTQLLLRWYDLHGRDLPWRQNPTPYTTVVSEIMLQQTRVEAVIPLYERFIKRFPDVKTLAAASQDEVLTYWQGLGYYSRARRLHQAAQIISREHHGHIPQDRDTLRSLPGIGDYTLGAILSMVFSEPVMAIDGNLLRIGARLFLIFEPINRAKAKRLIQTEFEKLIPTERPGDFNQGLMDLGSSICLPKNPRCVLCPIAYHCRAFLERQVAELPIKNAAKPPLPVQVKLYLIKAQGSVLLRKRDFGGFLEGMWELPWYETGSQSEAYPQLLVAEEHDWLAVSLKNQYPVEIRQTEYIFSHRHWMMTIYSYQVERQLYSPSEKDTHYLWQPQNKMDEIALPTVFKRALG